MCQELVHSHEQERRAGVDLIIMGMFKKTGLPENAADPGTFPHPIT